MINKIIRNFIAKQMAGRSDDGIMITLKDPQKITMAENIMMDTLMRNGINPRSITSEAQVKNILEPSEINPEHVITPGIFVQSLINIKNPIIETNAIEEGMTYP